MQSVERLLKRLGVSGGPSLEERVALTPGRAREQAFELVQSVVWRIVAIFLSHYSDVARDYLQEGWCPGYEDDEYDAIEANASSFADEMVALARTELGL